MIRRSVFFSALVLGMASSLTAHAENPLITDIRNLRNSLPITDASRPPLTLRLADTLVNEALKSRIALESNSSGKGAPVSAGELRRMEQEALSLYEIALRGEEGAKKKPSGEDALKISFQRARLMQELGQVNESLAIYREVGAQSEITSLKRESYLRIAEIQEQKDPTGKEVESAYRKTLEFCQGTDTCAYAHYRLAWYYRNQGNEHLAPAIAEVKQGLFDSKGALREEALRDWISFVAVNGGDGVATLNEFEEFSRKVGKPEILGQLGAAYFVAGNRVAGIRVLELVHSRNPKLISALKLLEEVHGQRDWAAVERLTAQAGTLTAQAATFTDAERADAGNILKRVSVQLDQDKSQDPKIKSAFQEVVDLDLALFPKGPDHAKMMEGWLASETDYATKAKKTESWIASPAMALTNAEQTHLREMLLFSAQKAKAYPDVVAQSEALENLAVAAGNMPKAREYRYLRAHAHYDAKENAVALPIFQALAAVKSAKEADEFAVKSQNLALDILNQEKRYSELTAQAAVWTGNSALKSDSKIGAEVAEMAKVSEQAAFQTYTAKGASPDALAFFLKSCQDGKYKPQSCENAKVLSVQLKDQASLIATLRVVGTPEELASELEAAGFFAESARIREKAASGDLKANLRVALFYELAGDEASRDRVLASILKSPAVKKPFPEQEDALLVMIRETRLFEPSVLSLAWSPKVKAQIADRFEVLGRSTPATKKILAASTENTGEGWAKIRVAEFRVAYEKQRAIGFYGRDGQRKLSQRLDLLKKLSASTEKVLNQSDLRLRFVLLDGLKRAYEELTASIQNSPIPAGLDENQLAALKNSLAELSAPFVERSKGYADLFASELAKAKEPSDTDYANAIAAAKEPTFDYVSASEAKKTSIADAAFDGASAKEALASLSRTPDDAGTLGKLENIYTSAGKPRLAAYYRGRILALQKEGK
ncbi:MAG: hypothetical protein JST04_09845 [Bdellovibrionales bacterium]|nr:hypothetical protein [Bdellovibrionales bacterium]